MNHLTSLDMLNFFLQNNLSIAGYASFASYDSVYRIKKEIHRLIILFDLQSKSKEEQIRLLKRVLIMNLNKIESLFTEAIKDSNININNFQEKTIRQFFDIDNKTVLSNDFLKEISSGNTRTYIKSSIIELIDSFVKNVSNNIDNNIGLLSLLDRNIELFTKRSNIIFSSSAFRVIQQTNNSFYVSKDFLVGRKKVVYRYTATLDFRTCLQCSPLDGQRAENPLSLPQPPLHLNCRCSIVPEYKNSPIKNMDFREWFEIQSESFKKQYLGKARYDLFKNSKLELKDFATPSRIKNLDELGL